MKKVSASLLFVVYLAFFASICVNGYVEQHNDLCEAKGWNISGTESSKTDAACCDYSFINGKIRHEFHHVHSSVSANQKFSFTNTSNGFVVNAASAFKQAPYAVAYTTPDLYKRIFLKIRVLLI